jgi:hypothetical protein
MMDNFNGRTTSPTEFREGAGSRLPLLSLLCVRFITLAALPFEALISYGDYRHFFDLARLSAEGGGLPFIGHWVEFPPLFPFLSLAIERLANGQLHTYVYLLALLMLFFDLGNLWVFSRLIKHVADEQRAERMTWLYMVFLSLPAFGWWTFEPMAVFFMLFSLWLILERKPLGAGLAAGLGFLTKLFPALCLVVAWRFRSRRMAIWTTLTAVVIAVVVLGTLLVANPVMAGASLRSQLSKGSWETVWAWIDGNFGTGIFGPLQERLDPAFALQPNGKPARIPLWIPTLVAGLIMLWIFIRAKSADDRSAFPFLVTFWGIFLLWSRGWSPQWVAYLIPLLFFAFPQTRALIYGLSLTLITLLEWPVLLSRGRFDLLWLPIIVRTLLLVMVAVDSGWSVFRESEPA